MLEAAGGRLGGAAMAAAAAVVAVATAVAATVVRGHLRHEQAVTRSAARRSGAAGSTADARTRAGVGRAYLVLLTPEGMRSLRPFR